MVDSLLDDVKMLLDKDFGDDRILKQICRACENNEVISNYERNYVKKLAEKHLRNPAIAQTSSVEEKPIVPDVVIQETSPIRKIQPPDQKPTQMFSSNSKNSKIVLGIAGIALVIVIATVVLFADIPEMSSTKVETPTTISDTLSVKTDLLSYVTNDIISISGVSDTSGILNLSIENQSNDIIWTEQVSVKSNGKYSTLAIAGGQGWEKSGTYTIKVNNDAETKSSTFSFTA